MKTKKFLSLLLALAMMLSLSVSVFANTNSNPSNEFNATATVTIPQISVVVPTGSDAKLFINPMGFQVKISDGTAAAVGAAADTVTTNNIVSPVNLIKNNSPMDLDVSVSAVLTPGTTNKALAVSATPIVTGDTKNSVFIYACFGTPGGTAAAPTLDDVDYEADKEDEGILALTTKAPSAPVKIGTVAASAAANTPTLFAFKFLGECNPDAKLDWNAGDTVAVKMAFTFKPASSDSTNSADGTDTGSGS